MKNLLEIGQIVNSYGIKGFLKVVPYTDDIHRYDELKTIYIEKNKKSPLLCGLHSDGDFLFLSHFLYFFPVIALGSCISTVRATIFFSSI